VEYWNGRRGAAHMPRLTFKHTYMSQCAQRQHLGAVDSAKLHIPCAGHAHVHGSCVQRLCC
jgi:hypothetical protein